MTEGTQALDGTKIRKSIENAQPTRKGDTLADKLNPYIGTTHEIRVTCALICRYATKLHRLAEEACNGPWWMDSSDRHIGSAWQTYKALGGVFPVAEHMPEDVAAAHQHASDLVAKHSAKMDRWQTEIDAAQETTEARLTWLVEFLPQPTDPETQMLGEAWVVKPESDPRGCSVIHGPEFVRGDSWGDSSGVCIPR